MKDIRHDLTGVSAGGFQCPDNGIPCVLLFDEHQELVWAEVERNGYDYSEEDIEETEAWCKSFGYRHCGTYEDAGWMCSDIENGKY
jgi:hypothetical protein